MSTRRTCDRSPLYPFDPCMIEALGLSKAYIHFSKTACFSATLSGPMGSSRSLSGLKEGSSHIVCWVVHAIRRAVPAFYRELHVRCRVIVQNG